MPTAHRYLCRFLLRTDTEPPDTLMEFRVYKHNPRSDLLTAIVTTCFDCTVIFRTSHQTLKLFVYTNTMPNLITLASKVYIFFQ